MLLSPGEARCPSPTTSFSHLPAHTLSPQAVNCPASPPHPPRSPSSSRWGSVGRGASWCLPAAGLLPVGEPLQPPQAGLTMKSRGLESSAEHLATCGQGQARRSPSFLCRAAQCYPVLRRESTRKGVNTHLSSEMELRPLCQDTEKQD